MHPIGKNIKILRQMQGVTQTRLAEAVGVAPAYISQIESMIRVPSVKVTHRIAEALGTTVGTLLGENPETEHRRPPLEARADPPAQAARPRARGRAGGREPRLEAKSRRRPARASPRVRSRAGSDRTRPARWTRLSISVHSPADAADDQIRHDFRRRDSPRDAA